MSVVGITDAALAEEAQALKNQVAHLGRVFDAVKDTRVQRVVVFVALFPAAPAARGLHLHVGNAEQALERTLRDGHLLKVGKAHGAFLNREQTRANTQAAVGDDIPAQLELEPHSGVGHGNLRQESQDRADFQDFEHDHTPRWNAFYDL